MSLTVKNPGRCMAPADALELMERTCGRRRHAKRLRRTTRKAEEGLNMGIADIERRKRELKLRERCFGRMVCAGLADAETGECETLAGDSDCFHCCYAAEAALTKKKAEA